MTYKLKFKFKLDIALLLVIRSGTFFVSLIWVTDHKHWHMFGVQGAHFASRLSGNLVN